MKLGLKILLLVLLPFLGMAQPITHFTQKDFTKNGELMLFLKGEWEYKAQGASTWKKIDPLKLDASIANEKGEIDGWLRYYFTVDSTIANEPLFMRFIYFASAAVFINGELIHNQNESTVLDFSALKKLKITSAQPNCLLIHIKDRKLGFPIYTFKQYFNPLEVNSIRFVNNRYLEVRKNEMSKFSFFYHLEIISLAIFSILFCILYFVNKRNPNLLYITLSNTLLCLGFLLLYISRMTNVSITEFILYQYIFRAVYWLFLLVLILTIFKLIGINITKTKYTILVLFILASILQIFIDKSNFSIGDRKSVV